MDEWDAEWFGLVSISEVNECGPSRWLLLSLVLVFFCHVSQVFPNWIYLCMDSIELVGLLFQFATICRFLLG